MTSKDKVRRDFEKFRSGCLGNLSSADRVRTFATAAAANNGEFIERLWSHAPREQYEMPELASKWGAQTVFLLSVLAHGELVRLGTELRVHKAERDRAVALVLLNEALSLLSHGQFDVSEYGITEIPDSWPDSYGPKYDPETSKLATKFRALFERTGLELPIPEAERSRPYFPELAAISSLAYRRDVSDPVFEELPGYRHSGIYRSEVLLIHTVVTFYRAYHAWRIVAEEHLGISLDEFLGVAQSGDDRGGLFATVDDTQLDEDQCETILSLHQLYPDAYEAVVEALLIHFDEEVDGVADPDEQVGEYVAALTPVIDDRIPSDSG